MKTPISFWLVILLCCSLFKYQISYAACPNVTPSFSASTNEVCGPGPVTISFINSSSGPNSGVSGYQWYLNGALFANTTGVFTSPTSNISGYGTYNYMMIAYDSIGFCQDTAYQVVTIVQKPVADFNFTGDTFCPNVAIPFTNASSNTTGSTYYRWGFTGGGASNNTNPTYSFGGAGGNRNISLMTFNSAGCSDTIVKSLFILPTPIISIGGDDGDGNLINCLAPFDTVTRQTVEFFNFSDSGITYTWDFGDGSPAVTQTYLSSPDTISHLFTSFGTFIVVCSAVDSNGCFYSDSLTVVFDKYISASFTVPISQISGCTPHFVQPTNASVNATRYRWNFGDGSPIITTNSYTAPSHVYTTTGNYTITLVASNDCNSSTSTVGPIVVNETPNMNFTHSLIGRGCAPETITFINTSQYVAPTNNFAWDMGNGFVSIGSDPAPQIYGTGTFTVTLVGGNGCGFDTVEQSFIIDSIPTAIFTGKDTSGCSPTTIDASAIPSGYNTLGRWYVDGVQVAIGDTLPTQTFSNTSDSSENHIVRYLLGNHCGYYDTSFVVTIHPNAQAILNSTPNPICAGTTLNHSSISSDTTLSYSWSFGDGTSAATIGPHSKTYNRSGLDSVKLVVNGFCGSDSVVKYIQIDSIPYANGWVNNSEGCSPLSVTGNSVSFGNGTTNFWVHNGFPISFVDSLSPYVFNHSGSAILYDSIRYFITNHCGNYDTTFNIIIHPEVDAIINPSSSLICVGDSVVFSDISSGDSLTYLWKFGNGDTSTQIGPHIRHFPAVGSDTTWLIVDGYCGLDSVSSITSTNPYPVADIINDVDSGCEDLRVNFNNRAPNGANYSWSFSNAIPGTSSLHSPSVLFIDSGVQNVNLAVDSLGCVSYDSMQIIVFPGPNPLFSYTPLSGCSDLAVSITNNSRVTLGDNYLWKFGNGDTSTQFTPALQVFTNSSNLIDSIYDIELVIYTNNGCNDSLTQTVRVHPIPESNFGVSDTVFCEKEIVSFYDSSVGASSFKWYFGDGDSSAFSSPTHSYDTAGTYTITFITSSFWNCSDTSYDTIVVNPNPRVIFYFDTACLSFSTNFSDSTLFGPVTWNWTFGDGNTSSLQNPTNLYLKDSTYSVSLVVSNNFGCFDSASHFVDVYKKPDAGFDISAACAKISTQFTDTSDGFPNSWLWYFGDGDSSTLQNPSHIYLVGGNYNVQLIVGNAAGCSDTITNTITITAVPGTYFIADTVCLGSPTYFIDSSSLTYPVLTRLWDFGNGNSSTQTNPVYQFINAGVYSVSLSITNINGCDSTYVGSVVVLPEPSASFLYDTVCFGDSTRFTNTSSGNIQYSVWNYGDGSPLDTNSNSVTHHVYANSGAFLVSLIITNNSGCVDTVSHIVFVEAQPNANFYPINDSVCLNKSTSFINTSVGGTNYLWRFGDGNTSSLTNPIHTYSSSGAYLVQLISTSSFGCIDSIVDTLHVLSNPIADFIVDTVCFTHESYFTNISLGTSLKYSWTFGDGYVDTVSNPIHLYPKDSNYQSSLVVTDIFGCTDTLIRTVTVLPKTTSNFDYSTACETRPILFSDSTIGNPISWRWNFGDGNMDSVQNPIHSYADSGVYSVTLITTNAQGCSDTIVKTVVVSPLPVAGFVSDTSCPGTVISFVD
ncbi:MAG: PKD domain-containing protein, partial [Flavobacteriales bacterium]